MLLTGGASILPAGLTSVPPAPALPGDPSGSGLPPLPLPGLPAPSLPLPELSLPEVPLADLTLPGAAPSLQDH